MIITNVHNLPGPFYNLAVADELSLEDNVYRVTSLLKGVRETILERRHTHEIHRDLSDMVWLLFGTAVHNILESMPESATQFKEERLKVAVGNYFVTGKFDLYDDANGEVIDYKTASVWKIIFGDFADWRRQTLIYCWMLRKIGFDARRAKIVAFLKDHSKQKAKFDPNYPQLPVVPVEFVFTEKDFVEIEEWLEARFALIAAAEQLSDDELPVCTPEERFNSGDKFAVMAKGKKKALRVLDSKSAAIDWMKTNGGDKIEERLGEDKKCADYCAACEFCNYHKEKSERNGKQNDPSEIA